MNCFKRVAIIGGGPAGLLMFKRFVNDGNKNFQIEIFERQDQTGVGMPYSECGASLEHITNVSGNEIPYLQKSLSAWIKELPLEVTKEYNIDPNDFNAYKVLPRLLFGQYLSAQFLALHQEAIEKEMRVVFHTGVEVTDIQAQKNSGKIKVQYAEQEGEFDEVIICSGHCWPIKNEGTFPGYYDSPYPPSKIKRALNHTVAIRGSSLTAIDAVRTLARYNGSFIKTKDGKHLYKNKKGHENFKMIMHSRNGLLPAIRFHLEDSNLSKGSILSKEEITKNRQENEGFLSLDYVFEKNFKEPIKLNDPQFYEKIKDMEMEKFVDTVMSIRERIPPFELFKTEYLEAEKSIRKRESIYWKEMLAVLSFTMNYPAKYFSAEDMQRLQKVLMPLISVVIAFVPQASAEEMLALYEAGVLDLVEVGDDSEVIPVPNGGVIYSITDDAGKRQEIHYNTFIDCIGQPHLNVDDLPFKGLLKNKTVSRAKLKFRSPTKGLKEMSENPDKVMPVNDNYYLKVPGITINDHFQVVNEAGKAVNNIFMMAVPFIGGYNPDYSGLDFCEEASFRVYEKLSENFHITR